MTAMQVGELWRYPVKSMQGERLDELEIGAGGVTGDRAFAVVDATDGKVASAKNPRKWARLLDCRAEFVDGDPGGPALITLPDGTSLRSDDANRDEALSRFLDREVTLVAEPPQGATFEETWPNIDGIAPTDFISSTRVRSDDDESVSDLALALAAPGSFFDLAPIHLVTTASLEELSRLAPDSRFVATRFRPNVVVDAGGGGFVENGWVGQTVVIGQASVQVMMPTMRCVMTTLAQPGLSQDRGVLQAAAAHNRVEISGLGEWACVGAYASVSAAGTVRVGDDVHL
jgi:uncharacterized protein YcbX